MDLEPVSRAEGGTLWMEQARCRELPAGVFFPSARAGVEVARRYCAQCPVVGMCLEYALRNGIDQGVWGGTSERERRRIARRRRVGAAHAGPTGG